MSGNQSPFFANPDTITFNLWPSIPVLICYFAVSCLIGNRLANVTATWVHRQGGEMDFSLFFHVFLQRNLMQLGVQLQLIFCGKYLIWFLPIFWRRQILLSTFHKWLLMDMNLGKFSRDSGSADVVTWYCSTAMGERSTQSAQARQQHHNLLLNRSGPARQLDNNMKTFYILIKFWRFI